MDARASAYDLSPYDETVLLDSDMMLLQPLDYCWEMVNDLDLYIASSPQDYRQRKFKYGAYRTEFKQNNWPDVYSAWTYFKKSPYAEKFFTTVKFIIKNQQEFLTNVLPDSMLTNIPTDEAFAIALAILGIEDTVVRPDWQSPRITHMKPAVQKFDNDVAEWNDNLRFMMNTLGQIKLGVWQQADILHYVKKELITENDLIMLEAVL